MSGLEDYWLLEGVIGFLKGPIWTTPVQHFLEQNCYVYGTSEIEEQDEEIIMECKKVHKMYKELVDALLSSFLKDIGCTNEQFIKICDRSKLSKHPAYVELLEQIWAADNYELFKSVMVRKNVELELQALVLLQCQLGLLTDLMQNEDQILSIVIQRSKDEYERRNSNVSNDELRIAKEIVDSKEAVKTLQQEIEQQDDINKKLLEMKLNDENTSGQKIELPRPASSRPKPQETKQPQVVKQPETKPIPKAPLIAPQVQRVPSARPKPNDNAVAEAAKLDVPINTAQEYLIKTDENMSANELQRRAEFMRKQRELLLERKRIEREKQLENYVKETEKKQEPRPMSSRAARAVLDGVEPNVIASKAKLSPEEEKERKKLEARRALAETLKKEVIKNSSKK